MKNKKGFTLAELMIAIVIIGILSFIVGTTYKGYVQKAKATEAETMLSEIYTAEEAYRLKNPSSKYLNVAETKENADLGVDFSRNKYFTSFTVKGSGTTAATVTTNTHDGMSFTMNIKSGGDTLLTMVGGGSKPTSRKVY